jgi:hypothetical protein
MYRIVGVLAFGVSRNVWWLVICPDLIKEYLLYRFLYERGFFSSMKSFMLVVPVKMIFEKWHHTVNDPMEN